MLWQLIIYWSFFEFFFKVRIICFSIFRIDILIFINAYRNITFEISLSITNIGISKATACWVVPTVILLRWSPTNASILLKLIQIKQWLSTWRRTWTFIARNLNKSIGITVTLFTILVNRFIFLFSRLVFFFISKLLVLCLIFVSPHTIKLVLKLFIYD